MPYISFEAGPLTLETKRQLISKLTEVSAQVMGIPADYFFVSIRELPNENIAIAGKNVNELRAELALRNR